MQRYRILAAAVLMQVCLGATYSWSVYVRPIREITGLLQGPVQLPFTVFYFVFPATMLLTGTLLPRLGPRFCCRHRRPAVWRRLDAGLARQLQLCLHHRRHRSLCRARGRLCLNCADCHLHPLVP